MNRVLMLFGGAAGDDAVARRSLNANNQGRAEAVAATTRRTFRGPQKGGRYSLDVRCDGSSGVTSATGITVWYSNLPAPSVANDNDWHQDTDAGTVLALTSTGKAFVDLAGRNAEWVMVKADVTAGTASIRVFARTEDL